jgi:Cu(I)/Ag(I) efflux system protein CusF
MTLGAAHAMDHKDMHHATEPAKTATTTTARSYAATGIVTKVDAAAGKVTIDHEPIKELYWPSMTMDFAVRDKALLDKLGAGKKVNFEIAKQGANYVITAVK